MRVYFYSALDNIVHSWFDLRDKIFRDEEEGRVTTGRSSDPQIIYNHTRPTGYDTRAGATVLIRGYLFAATKRWLYKDSSVAKVKSMDHKLILQDNCITAETYGLESRCSGAERGIEGTGVSGVGTGASLGPRGDISVILLDDETYQKIL